jgi:hypothetical protein
MLAACRESCEAYRFLDTTGFPASASWLKIPFHSNPWRGFECNGLVFEARTAVILIPYCSSNSLMGKCGVPPLGRVLLNGKALPHP